MKITRPTAISLSPNTEFDDVILAMKILFQPWKWFKTEYIERLERNFANYFGKNYKAVALNSGRSAEWVILKALGVKKDDEILIQSFTCVAVPNSIIWLDAKPVYLDTSNDFNINPERIESKVSSKSRIIIIQHTFGIPANFHAINKFAQKHNLIVIEDCAHSLGATLDGKKVGTLGDISFFSFGRDKVISSVFGGMILTSDEVMYQKILKERNKLSRTSFFWVFQQLLHPILFNFIILPFYWSGLGKLALFVFQKMNMLSFPVYKEEKEGKKPDVFPKKMPGALAILALNQLEKLDRYNAKRKEIAKKYFDGLNPKEIKLPSKSDGAIWMRFPILVKNPRLLFQFLKKNKILVGDWYKENIAPLRNSNIVGYSNGSCPNSETISTKIINLPTYPTLELKEVDRIMSLVSVWINSNQKQ